MSVTIDRIVPATDPESPLPQDGHTVTIHCIGQLEQSGAPLKKFWSTYDTNTPFSFTLGKGQVIKGMDAGARQLRVGERALVHMTADWGYGPNGFPTWGIPANCPLAFEITMVSFK